MRAAHVPTREKDTGGLRTCRLERKTRLTHTTKRARTTREKATTRSRVATRATTRPREEARVATRGEEYGGPRRRGRRRRGRRRGPRRRRRRRGRERRFAFPPQGLRRTRRPHALRPPPHALRRAIDRGGEVHLSLCVQRRRPLCGRLSTHSAKAPWTVRQNTAQAPDTLRQ